MFQAHLGVNIVGTVPYNCSSMKNKTAEKLDLSDCFKWNNETTLKMTSSNPTTDTKALCVNIDWESEVVNPILEDCIDLDSQYGLWYGGFVNDTSSFPVGQRDVAYGSYLPGEQFGYLVEKFWLSTSGVAVVASDNFPLYLRVDTSQEKGRLCLSSWYGHQKFESNQTRKLSYSICRSSHYQDTHKLVMDTFYSTSAAAQNRTIDSRLLSEPVFSTSGDVDALRIKLNDTGFNGTTYVISTAGNKLDKTLSGASDSSQAGFHISPYIPLSVAIDHLSKDMWIEFTDLGVPRLFKLNNTAYTMLNPTSPYTKDLIQTSLGNTSDLIVIDDLTIGDISGQDFYPYSEHMTTFQPYVHNFVGAVLDDSLGPVMTTVASAMQYSSIIYQLPPTESIADIVLKVLHSSMMGYNVISASPISAETFTKEEVMRLMQLSIFLPIMQFSDSVLDYFNDPQVKEMWEGCKETRKFWDIETKISQHLLTNPTAPLYTPVWWGSGDEHNPDLRTHTEFMFSDLYFVAPIVDVNSTSRVVHFPKGDTVWFWTSNKLGNAAETYTKNVFKGGDTEEFTNLRLYDLLVFLRVG